jgi:hypothetical protein
MIFPILLRSMALMELFLPFIQLAFSQNLGADSSHFMVDFRGFHV